MKRWLELQIRYSDEFMNSPDWQILYKFKRNCLLPILEKHSITDFLTLDEPKFVLFRAEVDENTLTKIRGDIQDYINEDPNFSNINVVDWSPEKDARDRILGAKQRALEGGVFFPGGVPEGGWKIVGRGRINKNWVAGPDDLERKVEEFARFMTKVTGRFTRVYLKEIEEGVDDPWMLSVFTHLILDSVSVWQNLEKMARDFPSI